MEEVRPTPEELLRRLRAGDRERDSRGKLKIFFGYAAGVGKTYAMLDAAHTAQKAGVDVMVGYIEPHTRPETLALLDGLKQLPALAVSYRGITLREFDLDGALKCHPQLILVDELAHTNAVGCRHRKRFDDVEELLRAGIDVYTTVNVQHLESLNDIVASITQITVQERIPDWVFDRADQVELVDIEPDDLIVRLQEGKIYQKAQAERALGNFFSRENLVALREIALRRTADRVNRQVESEKQSGDYFTSEHILVCLSSSPSNAKVIRTAARMAGVLHANLTALFVETPHTTELTDENRSRLRSNLKLAEQLGARIATVYGEEVPLQIAEYARASGVSKIILGRSNNKRKFFGTRQNFVEQLTALAPNLDVYIIPDNAPPYDERHDRRRPYKKLNLFDVGKSLGILAAATAIGGLFHLFGLSDTNIVTIYILGVLLISSLTSSRFYGILSSVLGVVVFNFFFTEPRFTLQANSGYPITFLVMLIAALITSTLTIRVRDQARAAAINAHRTEVLLETSQKLQRAASLKEIIEASSLQLIRLLNLPVLFYPVGADQTLEKPEPFLPSGWGELDGCYLSPDEQAVANWVYKNHKAAGISTDTLPGAKALYLPVRNQQEVLAVVGVAIGEKETLEPFERSLLLAMLSEIGFAMAKYQLNQEQQKIKMEAEKEQLRSNLLRAISHDLRTPLTGISGNASVLLTDAERITPEVRRELAQDIYDDSLWLINLVENLLAVTRIKDGDGVNIEGQPELLEELITEALGHLDRHSSEHTIEVKVKDDLLMAKVDARLIIQVIINIVNNAIKYTPPGSKITLSATAKNPFAVVEIADDGEGIGDENKEHIFDMFYTTGKHSSDSRRGLGLGLALCRSIVNAHGGSIEVQDNHPHGTIFRFTLPLVHYRGLAEPEGEEGGER